MKKKFPSLALALALCLSLAVPAFAVETTTFENEHLKVTNVIKHEESDAELGGVMITCVAPAQVTVIPAERGKTEFLYDNLSDVIAEGVTVTADDVYKYGCDDVVEEGFSATFTEPGIYMVEIDVRPSDEDDEDLPELAFTRYLVVVQNGEVDPNPTVPDTTDPTTTTPSFTDVKSGDWYYDSVQWAVEQEITNGTTPTTFSPKQDCTVAHILTFLWRASGSPKPAGENPFGDVKPGDWFADAAAWAKENGMVSGDTFGPNAPCTRSMAVTYLWKAAGSPEAKAASFTDVPASADYAKAVNWAVEQGVTDGTSAATFSPDTVCTRGHIVTFLYRAFAE